MIADLLVSKTEAQVRQFFTNSRRRLSLDVLMKEHEARQQAEDATNTDADLSKNPIPDPKFVIDSKSKTSKRSDNIIMEVKL